MKLNIYTVLDSKSGAYSPPFFMQKDGMALRTFSDLANDRKTSVGVHPEDYSLYRIGTFDDNTALVTSCKPSPLSNAVSLVQTPQFPDLSMATAESLEKFKNSKKVTS